MRGRIFLFLLWAALSVKPSDAAKADSSTCSGNDNDYSVCPQSECYGESVCCHSTGICLNPTDNTCKDANECGVADGCGDVTTGWPTALNVKPSSNHATSHATGDGCTCEPIIGSCDQTSKSIDCWGILTCTNSGSCHTDQLCTGTHGVAPLGSFCWSNGASATFKFCGTDETTTTLAATTTTTPTPSTCSGETVNLLSSCPQSECYGDSMCCHETGLCTGDETLVCAKAGTCSFDECSEAFPAVPSSTSAMHLETEDDGCYCKRETTGTGTSTSQAGCASKTCSELKSQDCASEQDCWQNSNYHYSYTHICAETEFDGNCHMPNASSSATTTNSGGLSYSAAEAFCTERGARLCSMTELRYDVARDTGCNIDANRVWTLTSCEGGHVVQGGTWSGSQSGGLGSSCQGDTGIFGVVCCASASSTSEDACQEEAATPCSSADGTHTCCDDVQYTYNPVPCADDFDCLACVDSVNNGCNIDPYREAYDNFRGSGVKKCCNVQQSASCGSDGYCEVAPCKGGQDDDGELTMIDPQWSPVRGDEWSRAECTACHGNGCDQCNSNHFKYDYISACVNENTLEACSFSQQEGGCGMCLWGTKTTCQVGPNSKNFHCCETSAITMCPVTSAARRATSETEVWWGEIACDEDHDFCGTTGYCRGEAGKGVLGSLCVASESTESYRYCSMPLPTTTTLEPSTCSGDSYNFISECPQSECYGDSTCCAETGACLQVDVEVCIKAHECSDGPCGGTSDGFAEAANVAAVEHFPAQGDGCLCEPQISGGCGEEVCWGKIACDATADSQCRTQGWCSGNSGGAPPGQFCTYSTGQDSFMFCPVTTTTIRTTTPSTCSDGDAALCPQSQCYGSSTCCYQRGTCLSTEELCTKVSDCPAGTDCGGVSTGFPVAGNSPAKLVTHSASGDGCACTRDDCDGDICWGRIECTSSEALCGTQGYCEGANGFYAQDGEFCISTSSPGTEYRFCPSGLVTTSTTTPAPEPSTCSGTGEERSCPQSLCFGDSACCFETGRCLDLENVCVMAHTCENEETENCGGTSQPGFPPAAYAEGTATHPAKGDGCQCTLETSCVPSSTNFCWGRVTCIEEPSSYCLQHEQCIGDDGYVPTGSLCFAYSEDQEVFKYCPMELPETSTTTEEPAPPSTCSGDDFNPARTCTQTNCYGSSSCCWLTGRCLEQPTTTANPNICTQAHTDVDSNTESDPGFPDVIESSDFAVHSISDGNTDGCVCFPASGCDYTTEGTVCWGEIGCSESMTGDTPCRTTQACDAGGAYVGAVGDFCVILDTDKRHYGFCALLRTTTTTPEAPSTCSGSGTVNPINACPQDQCYGDNQCCFEMGSCLPDSTDFCEKALTCSTGDCGGSEETHSEGGAVFPNIPSGEDLQLMNGGVETRGDGCYCDLQNSGCTPSATKSCWGQLACSDELACKTSGYCLASDGTNVGSIGSFCLKDESTVRFCQDSSVVTQTSTTTSPEPSTCSGDTINPATICPQSQCYGDSSCCNATGECIDPAWLVCNRVNTCNADSGDCGNTETPGFPPSEITSKAWTYPVGGDGCSCAPSPPCPLLIGCPASCWGTITCDGAEDSFCTQYGLCNGKSGPAKVGTFCVVTEKTWAMCPMTSTTTSTTTPASTCSGGSSEHGCGQSACYGESSCCYHSGECLTLPNNICEAVNQCASDESGHCGGTSLGFPEAPAIDYASYHTTEVGDGCYCAPSSDECSLESDSDDDDDDLTHCWGTLRCDGSEGSSCRKYEYCINDLGNAIADLGTFCVATGNAQTFRFCAHTITTTTTEAPPTCSGVTVNPVEQCPQSQCYGTNPCCYATGECVDITYAFCKEANRCPEGGCGDDEDPGFPPARFGWSWSLHRNQERDDGCMCELAGKGCELAEDQSRWCWGHLVCDEASGSNCTTTRRCGGYGGKMADIGEFCVAKTSERVYAFCGELPTTTTTTTTPISTCVGPQSNRRRCATCTYDSDPDGAFYNPEEECHQDQCLGDSTCCYGSGRCKDVKNICELAKECTKPPCGEAGELYPPSLVGDAAAYHLNKWVKDGCTCPTAPDTDCVLGNANVYCWGQLTCDNGASSSCTTTGLCKGTWYNQGTAPVGDFCVAWLAEDRFYFCPNTPPSTCSGTDFNYPYECPQEECLGESTCCLATGRCVEKNEDTCIQADACGSPTCASFDDYPTSAEVSLLTREEDAVADGCHCEAADADCALIEGAYCWGKLACDDDIGSSCTSQGVCRSPDGLEAPLGTLCIVEASSTTFAFCPQPLPSTCSGDEINFVGECGQAECYGESTCCYATGQCKNDENVCFLANTCTTGDCGSTATGFPTAADVDHPSQHTESTSDGCTCAPKHGCELGEGVYCWGHLTCDEAAGSSCTSTGQCQGSEGAANVGGFCVATENEKTFKFCPSDSHSSCSGVEINLISDCPQSKCYGNSGCCETTQECISKPSDFCELVNECHSPTCGDTSTGFPAAEVGEDSSYHPATMADGCVCECTLGDGPYCWGRLACNEGEEGSYCLATGNCRGSTGGASTGSFCIKGTDESFSFCPEPVTTTTTTPLPDSTCSGDEYNTAGTCTQSRCVKETSCCKVTGHCTSYEDPCKLKDETTQADLQSLMVARRLSWGVHWGPINFDIGGGGGGGEGGSGSGSGSASTTQEEDARGSASASASASANPAPLDHATAADAISDGMISDGKKDKQRDMVVIIDSDACNGDDVEFGTYSTYDEGEDGCYCQPVEGCDYSTMGICWGEIKCETEGSYSCQETSICRGSNGCGRVGDQCVGSTSAAMFKMCPVAVPATTTTKPTTTPLPASTCSGEIWNLRSECQQNQCYGHSACCHATGRCLEPAYTKSVTCQKVGECEQPECGDASMFAAIDGWEALSNHVDEYTEDGCTCPPKNDDCVLSEGMFCWGEMVCSDEEASCGSSNKCTGTGGSASVGTFCVASGNDKSFKFCAAFTPVEATTTTKEATTTAAVTTTTPKKIMTTTNEVSSSTCGDGGSAGSCPQSGCMGDSACCYETGRCGKTMSKDTCAQANLCAGGKCGDTNSPGFPAAYATHLSTNEAGNGCTCALHDEFCDGSDKVCWGRLMCTNPSSDCHSSGLCSGSDGWGLVNSLCFKVPDSGEMKFCAAPETSTSTAPPAPSTCSGDDYGLNFLQSCPQAQCYGASSCCYQTGQCLTRPTEFCLAAHTCESAVNCGDAVTPGFPSARDSPQASFRHYDSENDGCTCQPEANKCQLTGDNYCWGKLTCDGSGSCAGSGECEDPHGKVAVGDFCIAQHNVSNFGFCRSDFTTTTSAPPAHHGADMVCPLNCYGPAATPVLLSGSVGFGSGAYVEWIDQDECIERCQETLECEAVAYSPSTQRCYGRSGVMTAGTEGGCLFQGDFVTAFMNGKAGPWGKCSIIGDPHVTGFDHQMLVGGYNDYMLPIGIYESGYFDLVHSEDVHVQARFGFTQEYTQASSLLGITVTGSILSYRKVTVAFVGPASETFYEGWQVHYRGKQILKEPGEHTSQDGLVRVELVQKSPYEFCSKCRAPVTKDDTPWGYVVSIGNPMQMQVYILPGYDFGNAVITMRKVEGQDGVCGNFNCEKDDDTKETLTTRGYLAARSSIFPVGIAPPSGWDRPSGLSVEESLRICPQWVKASCTSQGLLAPQQDACVFDVCMKHARDSRQRLFDVQTDAVATDVEEAASRSSWWLLRLVPMKVALGGAAGFLALGVLFFLLSAGRFRATAAHVRPGWHTVLLADEDDGVAMEGPGGAGSRDMFMVASSREPPRRSVLPHLLLE